MIEGPQIVIVLVIILVLFGSSKLPELARSIGQASNEFKKGLADHDSDADSATVQSDGESSSGNN